MQNYYTFFEKIVKQSRQNLPNCQLKNFNFLLKNEKKHDRSKLKSKLSKVFGYFVFVKNFCCDIIKTEKNYERFSKSKIF